VNKRNIFKAHRVDRNTDDSMYMSSNKYMCKYRIIVYVLNSRTDVPVVQLA
jgi:hypothetical protein